MQMRGNNTRLFNNLRDEFPKKSEQGFKLRLQRINCVDRTRVCFLNYTRVSTGEQDLTIQREALIKAGCSQIRKEKRSGTSRADRTELETLLAFMREGDVLMVTRMGIERPLLAGTGLSTTLRRCTGRGFPPERGRVWTLVPPCK